jgi:hypothetical protein
MTTLEEKILEKLNKFYPNFANNQKFAKEIASLFEGYYEKEFVRWLYLELTGDYDETFEELYIRWKLKQDK